MINSIISALSNSRSKFLKVFHILSKNKISDQDIELIEEMLVETDIGYDLTNDIIDIIHFVYHYYVRSYPNPQQHQLFKTYNF